jgi:hypothetical protein
MSIGRGIAVAGIWIGVGIAAFGGDGAVFIALFALFATAVVAP